jgi:preprotein translocase subunit YajC
MPESSAAAPGPLAMLFPIAMMFFIFYVLVLRPQAKMRKDHETMVKSLKKHDEVVTTGGIFGTVMNVRPESITLRVDENVRIEVEPSAIGRLVKPKAGTAAAPAPAGKSA